MRGTTTPPLALLAIILVILAPMGRPVASSSATLLAKVASDELVETPHQMHMHDMTPRQRFCQQQTGERKLFCSQFVPPRNVQLLKSYQKMRDEACKGKWVSQDQSDPDLHFMYRWFRNNNEYSRSTTSPNSFASKVQLQACHVQVEQGDLRGKWSFERVGPMTGTGGNDWHQFQWMPIRGYWKRSYARILNSTRAQKMARKWKQPAFAAGDGDWARQEALTGYYISVVDGNGAPIQHPPVHTHHTHLNPTGCWYNPEKVFAYPKRSVRKKVFAQLHGDSQCSAADGGMACHLAILPPGYAYQLPKTLCIDTELNGRARARARDG